MPNNLTVEKNRTGNSNIRNPILISYIAKGMLPYRGIGSEIRKALNGWQYIDFHDDRDEILFTVIVHPKIEKSSMEIQRLLSDTPRMTIPELARELGISTKAIEKQITKLQEKNS